MDNKFDNFKILCGHSPDFFHTFVTACSRKKDKPTADRDRRTVDANNSDIVVSGGPVVADGAATAAVAITLKDIKGDAVAGVTRLSRFLP